jgi:DNA-binding MarR family transcriptional regulator
MTYLSTCSDLAYVVTTHDFTHEVNCLVAWDTRFTCEVARTLSPVTVARKGRSQPDTRWLSSDEQEAWRAIAMIFLQLPGPLDAQLRRDSGITLFEYLVLSYLSMAPRRSLRMSELADFVNGSLSRLSNVAKRLEQRGWLRREPDPGDGRYTIAHLTDSGWHLVRDSAPGHVDAVRRLVIDPLTDTQLRTLSAVGRRLGKSLDGADLTGGGDCC